MSSIIYSHIFISDYVILTTFSYHRFLIDPLYEEIVTNSSDLMAYMYRHVFIELILPLSIFVVVMLTLLVDLTCIPVSSIERKRANSLEEFKKHLFEIGNF